MMLSFFSLRPGNSGNDERFGSWGRILFHQFGFQSRLRHFTKQVEELEQQLRQRVRENHVKSPNQIRIDFGKPYVKILELCEGLMASTLIMASHSHTMAGRLIMGSNTDYLLHHAHCSMYILKNYELDNH